MDEATSKKMMDMINRQRKLTSEYLRNQVGPTRSSFQKPSVLEAINDANIVSDSNKLPHEEKTSIHVSLSSNKGNFQVHETTSRPSRWEPKLQLQVPDSPSTSSKWESKLRVQVPPLPSNSKWERKLPVPVPPSPLNSSQWEPIFQVQLPPQPSGPSKWEPRLQVQVPPSPSRSFQREPRLQVLVPTPNLHSSISPSSTESTPETEPSSGPRWWQKQSPFGNSSDTLVSNVSLYEQEENKNPKCSPSMEPSPSTSWISSNGSVNTQPEHSKANEGDVPSFGKVKSSDLRQSLNNSQSTINTKGNAKVHNNQNNFPSTSARRSSRNLEIGNLRYGNSPLPSPPATLSRPKVHDTKGHSKQAGGVVHDGHERQQFYLVPPPRRRVHLSEYFVGELVIIRENRHAWLPASIRKLTTRGLKVWVKESNVFVNIPPELLYTHLRKLDGDLEHLFPTASFQGHEKDEHNRLISDKDLQQFCKSSSTIISSGGLCPVNLVRPAHLAHRRLHQPPKILSCIICYEGMSTMEAHFPWDCNHGSHLQCLEMKLQHCSFESFVEACCPTCRENIARSQKLRILGKSSSLSLSTSNLHFSLEGQHHGGGIRGAHEKKNIEDRSTGKWIQSNSEPTTTAEVDNDFKVSDWRTVRCSCGFQGIARKNVQLGMPPICPACKEFVSTSSIAPEKNLLRTLLQSTESPPTKLTEETPLTIETAEDALFTQSHRSHPVDQTTTSSREVEIRSPSSDIFGYGSSSHVPIDGTESRQVTSYYEDVESFHKHSHGTTSHVIDPIEMKEQNSPHSKVLHKQDSPKASLTRRPVEIGEIDQPSIRKYTQQEETVFAKQPSKPITTKDASIASQHDLNALGALGMPRWSSRGKGKAAMPRDSLSFYVTPLHVKQKMDELEAGGITSIGVEMDSQPLSTQWILEEGNFDEERVDTDLSIGGQQSEKVEQVQSSTSRTTLGPLGMSKRSSSGKGKAAIATDPLSFNGTTLQMKQNMGEVEGKTPRTVEMNYQSLSTQCILEDDFNQDSEDMHVSINEQKQNLHDKPSTSQYMKEDKVLTVQPFKTPTTTQDVSIEAPQDLISLGALGMPRWSSRSKGKAAMPTDSLSFYITPSQIKKKMEESAVGGKTFECPEMDSPISTQSILEDNSDEEEDWPFVGYTEQEEEIQPHMSSNLELTSLRNSKTEKKFGQSISRPKQTVLHPIPEPPSGSYQPPTDFVSAYTTDNPITQKRQERNNMLGTNHKRASLPPEAPSPMRLGLGMTRPKGHALPTDSLSFYITPLQIKQQLERLDKWSSDMDSAQRGLDRKGESSIESSFTFDEEEEDRMQEQIPPPFEIPSFHSRTSPPFQIASSHSQTSPPHVQSKASGLPSQIRHAMPTDSLSFYITPALIKQQMAKLQQLEEEAEVLEEDLALHDNSEVPPLHAPAPTYIIFPTTRATDHTLDTESQTDESAFSSLALAPLQVIPEDAAISTDDSSTPSSPSILECESQLICTTEPTSLAVRLKKMKFRKSKSAPSTPSQAPASAIRRITSWSAPSTPAPGTSARHATHGFENDRSIHWITVRRTY